MISRQKNIVNAASALRVGDWWSFVIPPILGIGYMGILVQDNSISNRHALSMLLLLLSTVGMASFGFLLNQWTDREEDALGGKQNTTANLAFRPVLGLLILSALLASLPWCFHDFSLLQWTCIGLQFGTLLIYHVPPIRAKNHSVLAVLLDSLYSSVFYSLLAWSLFQELQSAQTMLLLVWCFGKGLRNIILHQIQDQSADAASGRITLAHRFGLRSLRTAVLLVIFPAETFAGIIWMAAVDVPMAVLALYTGWSLVAFIQAISNDGESPKLSALNHGFELILPYSTIALLMWKDPKWWFFLHFLLFPRPFVFLYRHFKIRLKKVQEQEEA